MSEVAAKPDFPPVRLLLLIALWALLVVYMLVGVIVDPVTTSDAAPGLRSPSTYSTLLVSLDFWGLIAGLVLGLIGFNPFRWLNGKRLIFGCMACAVVFGRLGTGWLLSRLTSIALPKEIIFAGTPLVLLLGGIGIILAIAFVAFLVFYFFVAVPVSIFNQVFAFERELAIYRYQSHGLAGYIVRAVFWLRNQPLPVAPPDESRGARFATQGEAAALHNATKANPARMGFGHWAGKADTPFFIATDKHVLVMASTRSGKGVSLIIPHLLRYRGSAFVLDPKGENARATGRQRAALNGRVHYLDPFGISGQPRSRYNPLSRFTPENMEAESKALAAALFVVEARNRDHWSDSGQQLLAALILYVYLAPTIAPADKDLVTVRKVLLRLVKEALAEMVEMDEAAGGLLRDLAISFQRTPEKEFGSIVSTAQRQTEILDNPSMQACLAASGSAPEVDFTAWQRGTMTVYLCLAAPKFPTFNRWLRLVLTSALDTMTEQLNPPKLPVCFMLDELATLGKLETVENAVGLSAGYGIQLVTVFQDVAQMRGLYGGRWASFVGNAGVRALFNLDDHESAEYWSKFMGERLVETSSRQEDLYGLSAGRNVGETMRPLVATDRLMMDFASGRMLVLAQGARPIVTDRMPYYADTTLAGLWDDPRAPLPAKAAAGGGPRLVPPSGPSPAPGGAGPQPSSPPPNPRAAAPQPTHAQASAGIVDADILPAVWAAIAPETGPSPAGSGRTSARPKIVPRPVRWNRSPQRKLRPKGPPGRVVR